MSHGARGRTGVARKPVGRQSTPKIGTWQGHEVQGRRQLQADELPERKDAEEATQWAPGAAGSCLSSTPLGCAIKTRAKKKKEEKKQSNGVAASPSPPPPPPPPPHLVMASPLLSPAPLFSSRTFLLFWRGELTGALLLANVNVRSISSGARGTSKGDSERKTGAEDRERERVTPRDDPLSFDQVTRDPQLSQLAIAQLRNHERRVDGKAHGAPKVSSLGAGARQMSPQSVRPRWGPVPEQPAQPGSGSLDGEQREGPWRPLKKISRAQMDQLRLLHEQVVHFNSFSLGALVPL